MTPMSLHILDSGTIGNTKFEVKDGHKVPKKGEYWLDATSRDERYLGRKIHWSILTLGHTDQRGLYSRGKITRTFRLGTDRHTTLLCFTT
jgi:hypothetical protein